MPPKEGGETVREFGPMGKVLIATDQLVPDVYKVEDHMAAHEAEPPPAGATLEYGAHIINICTGCHREELNGGPMPFGPPDWPPASNLTPHADGIAEWTFEDFEKVMRRGQGPDGEPVKIPMAEMLPFAAEMTDDELQAMFMHLKQLPGDAQRREVVSGSRRPASSRGSHPDRAPARDGRRGAPGRGSRSGRRPSCRAGRPSRPSG